MTLTEPLDADSPAADGTPPSATDTLARLEWELAFGLIEDAQAARRELQQAGERNNPSLIAEAQARLRRNVHRNNDIVVNLLPLARMRAAAAQYPEHARRVALPAQTRVELAGALDVAEGRLSVLTREYADLPGLLRLAANGADADAIVSHRRRLDELPTLVTAAQAAVIRLQIAQFEAEEVEARDAQPAAVADMEAARAAFEKAQTKYETARSAHGALVGGERAARADAAEYRRRLGALLAEQGMDRGPIVRSRIHAGRGLGDG